MLIHRELGLPETESPELLDAPATGAVTSLHHQRAHRLERIGRLPSMVASVDRMVEAATSGILLFTREKLDAFGAGWDPWWVSRARQRWGRGAQ